QSEGGPTQLIQLTSAEGTTNSTKFTDNDIAALAAEMIPESMRLASGLFLLVNLVELVVPSALVN
ncbi:MAG: hypothetical protein AAFO02_26670, partial [Bacteroidota bacterium]